MATWPNWEQDVLDAGGWPVTAENVRFLEEWEPYENSKCANNPLDTTLRVSGSTNCVETQTPGVWVQNYSSPSSGAKATANTIKGPFYLALGPALASGDPYSYPDSQTIAQDITTWGTPRYAAFFLTQVGGGASGSTSGTALPALGLRGYADARNSIGHHLPTQLERSRKTGEVTLRLLARKPRVGG